MPLCNQCMYIVTLHIHVLFVLAVQLSKLSIIIIILIDIQLSQLSTARSNLLGTVVN